MIDSVETVIEGKSTNQLLHLIKSDTPSKTTDDLPSGISKTTAKQAEALTSSKEPTDAMGEEELYTTRNTIINEHVCDN